MNAAKPPSSQDQQQNAQEGATLVHVLATVLDRLCVANVAVARADPGQVTKFHAMKAPGIGILQYLERIHKYASCSNECFVLALIYIDRLIQRNNFLLTELNVHRVVITAVLLAAKFFDDAYYNNAYYAKVGGVLVSEMNGLEVDFLFRINFSLHVTPEVFEKYRAELLSQATAAHTAVSPTPVQHEMQVSVSPSPPAANTVHYGALPVAPSHPSSPMATTTANNNNTNPSQQLCNPQAPASNGFPPPAPPSAQTDPYLIKATHAAASSQITPPPGHTQLVYPPTSSGMVTDAPPSFPVQFSEGPFGRVQRANSYPALTTPTGDSSVYSRNGSDSSYSAPAIITPAVQYHPAATAPPSGVAAMMEHQIFPLQNALVHHNHGAASAYSIQPKPDPRGQMLTGGVL